MDKIEEIARAICAAEQGMSWDYLVERRRALYRGQARAAYEVSLEEIDRLHTRLAETQMLAFKWMEAHDKLHAGKPYSFPKPADFAYEVMASSDGDVTDAMIEAGTKAWYDTDHEGSTVGQSVADIYRAMRSTALTQSSVQPTNIGSQSR